MNFDDTKHVDTVMSDAFERAGVERHETPQEAAERFWKETAYQPQRPHGGGPKGHDPIETMRRFSEWALQRPERMLAILGEDVWQRAVRGFLQRDPRRPGSWKHSGSFQNAMNRLERERLTKNEIRQQREKASRWTSEEAFLSRKITAERNRRKYARKKAGIKLVQAEVDVATGVVVNLIDKEYGPFAHIRINGLELPEATTEQALAWCDTRSTDERFIRALCQMIPDPRKPIGEQWTADMIRQAREVAHRGQAA